MSEITSCLAGPAPAIPTPEVESRVASGLERKEALTAPRGSLSILSCSHHSWARSEQVRAGPGCRGSRDPLPSPESSLDGLGPRGAWGRTCGGLGRITGQGPDPDPPTNQQLFSLDPQAWG